MNLTIRIATKNDILGILTLFEETIRTVNSKDYNQQEIDVWVSCSKNNKALLNTIKEQTFYVAVIENLIVGFSSITTKGYLDLMYVHKDYQRKGIASRLLKNIEAKSKEQINDEIYAHVSKTALPFFKKHEFEVSGIHKNTVQGITFYNTIMKKKILPPS